MPGRDKTTTSPADKAAHYHGHRRRLRQRFLAAGSEAISDYEMLELILFRAIPQRDVKPLAKNLLATFGSFSEVIAAPAERLNEVDGLGEAAITELKIVQAAANRLVRGEVKQRQVLSSWSNVLDYCRAAMAFESKEHFRILFLDKGNHLIADEQHQTGTVDHTPVYPREVVKRARPSHRRQGRPRESEGAEADLAMSRRKKICDDGGSRRHRPRCILQRATNLLYPAIARLRSSYSSQPMRQMSSKCARCCSAVAASLSTSAASPRCSWALRWRGLSISACW